MSDSIKNQKSKIQNYLRHINPGAAAIVGVFVFFFWAFVSLDTYRPMYQTVHANDPVGYYAWIHSMLFDGDLDFENEYRILNRHTDTHQVGWANPDGPRTATGHLPNYFSMGPGLLWAPFLLAIHPIAHDLGGERNGFSQPYHMAVFFAISFYGLLGVLLTYGFLRTWFNRFVSAFAAIAAWAASPALFYTYPDIAMSHSCCMFSVALFLFAWARLRVKTTWWAWSLVGLALGFSALVRWQNVLFAVIPAIDLLWKPDAKKLARLAFCAAAAVVGFAPQMIGWKVVFGSFFTVPQGPDFIQWLRPHVFAVLFSPAYGLITWTPLCGIAMLAYGWAPKEQRRAYAAMFAAFVLQVYINAAALNLGWTFGMRRMCDCVPLFAAGLAVILLRSGRFSHYAAAGMLVFVVWNFLFVLQYAGFADGVYVDRAVSKLAREQKVSVEALREMRTLPNGQPFNIYRFVYANCFPRGGTPTFRQFVPDKSLVVRLLLNRVLGLAPPQ